MGREAASEGLELEQKKRREKKPFPVRDAGLGPTARRTLAADDEQGRPTAEPLPPAATASCLRMEGAMVP